MSNLRKGDSLKIVLDADVQESVNEDKEEKEARARERLNRPLQKNGLLLA